MRYRTWITNEIYSLLRKLQVNTLFNDAKLFLYMIEGTIIQLLSLEKRDDMFACFSKAFIRKSEKQNNLE